ncbi:MAG: Nif3-like dinuclear metal center hexameric protein [Deinococcales bacterium]
MKRDDLAQWLDSYLDIHSYNDISLNGLQVEGSDDVRRIAVAVDSSLSTFEQAAQLGADMLIVHHGLFWGKPLALSGMHLKRVRFLLEHNISLYAAHIPLDAHQEVGNNLGAGKTVGLSRFNTLW